jgi:hypothetical protein
VIDSNGALEEIDRKGMRIADPRDILAFGVAFPDKQKYFPIVCLHPVTQQNQVFVLSEKSSVGGKSQRRIMFISYDAVWDWDSRFLVVRKEDS